MKKILLSIFVLASLSFADVYKLKCASCHGATGEKVALGKSKIIKDMSKADFIAAMNGYKDGTYGGPMKGLMKGQVNALTEDDIKALAEQIAQ
ncbi:MAG: c-type cytochrome [Arcobacteraceae bacterium]